MTFPNSKKTGRKMKLNEPGRQKKLVGVLSQPQRILLTRVSTASPSHEGMLRFLSGDINQPRLPTPFILFLVSVSVSMALSTTFYSINFPNNSPFCHYVLPVLFLPYWSFQLYILLTIYSLYLSLHNSSIVD